MRESEKPFDFVMIEEDLIDHGPARDKAAGHHVIKEDRISGYIRAEMVTLTPVQVACGLMKPVRVKKRGEWTEEVALDHYRVRDGAVIPGSSVKGAVRAVAEAISPSCLAVQERRTRPNAPKRLRQCSIKGNGICPACRIFGTMGYQGQARFHDIVIPPKSLIMARVPILWKPGGKDERKLASLYIEEDGFIRGRKFYYHARYAERDDARVAVKKGVTAEMKVSFQNLSESEFGLLIAAMGCHPLKRFPIKIGAGKPVGLGSVEIKPIEIGLLQRDQIARTGRMGGMKRTSDDEMWNLISRCVFAAERDGTILPDPLEDVVGIYDRVGLENQAPSGPY
ncbi:hypothetical protein J7M22_18605 [Candidatus Poribacteria bacterium]|nr:hypothetical protein [Candidatus Poribacteria bacterium]